MGSWGRGSVRLIELHTPDETNDNIVACWVPAELPQPGTPLEFSYKLHWFLDQIRPPAGMVGGDAARPVAGPLNPTSRRFVVDFDGPALRRRSAEGPAVRGGGQRGRGAPCWRTIPPRRRSPYNGTWRAAFALQPMASGKPGWNCAVSCGTPEECAD